MSSTAGGGTTQTGAAERLGFTTGMVIQELGWDDDTDDQLRMAIEDAIDADMVDGLVEALTDLVGGGAIWLLTPKIGRPGCIDAADIAEAAPIAGLSQTTTAPVSADWAAIRLLAPKTPQ